MFWVSALINDCKISNWSFFFTPSPTIIIKYLAIYKETPFVVKAKIINTGIIKSNVWILRSMEKLESLIKTYYDFPKKGIAFKDILGIIQDPEVFRELILKMSYYHVI